MIAPIATIIAGVLVLVAIAMQRSASKAGDAAKAKTWKTATWSLVALLVVCIAWLSVSR